MNKDQARTQGGSVGSEEPLPPPSFLWKKVHFFIENVHSSSKKAVKDHLL